MIDDAHPAQFASDGFQHAGPETIFIAERRQNWQKLTVGIF